MRKEDAEAYVISKGWDYKTEGDELLITPCPFCGDHKGRFSVNKKMGLWQCFKCEDRGNLYQLKEKLGDLAAPTKMSEAWGDVSYDVVGRDLVSTYSSQMAANIMGKQYLYSRGIGDELIALFHIGLDYKNDGSYLAFPYFRDGLCVNVKYRSIPPAEKKFQLRPKHEKPLYNVDMLDKTLNYVILCEGEIDCISLVGMGFKNVVSLPNGAGHFESDHWDVLVGFETIYIIMDPDGAGRAGVKAIANRLGADRCMDVRIPNGLDPNDILQKFGWTESYRKIQACLDDAKPFGEGDVSGVRGALQELYDHIVNVGSVEEGISSPWPSLNNRLGVISPGEVILLQAIPKTGKTTLALQWLSYVSRDYGVPSMMYCLEMPIRRLAQSLVSQTTRTHREKLTSLDVRMTTLKYMNAPLYFGGMPKLWEFKHIKEVITYSVKRFGIQFICFDNLQLLCRSVQDTWAEQANVSRGFKELAQTLNISILLVVQPKKMDPKFSPGMYDPSGSASIIADADGMISMWRKPTHTSDQIITDDMLAVNDGDEEPAFGPETLLTIPASRYRSGGRTVLYFEGEKAVFSEVGGISNHSN